MATRPENSWSPWTSETSRGVVYQRVCDRSDRQPVHLGHRERGDLGRWIRPGRFTCMRGRRGRMVGMRRVWRGMEEQRWERRLAMLDRWRWTPEAAFILATTTATTTVSRPSFATSIAATNSSSISAGFTTPATWSPSTGFGPTNRLQVNVNGTTYLFTEFTGGTTGSSAPSWPTSAGTGVFDGTMEWINQGVYYGRAGCAAQTDSWGDGRLASEATVGTVGGIALDWGGNLFFSDTAMSPPTRGPPRPLHDSARGCDDEGGDALRGQRDVWIHGGRRDSHLR